MSTKEQKIHGRKAKLPVLCFLNLSAHFYVWVTVWVRRLTHILTHTIFSVFATKKHRKPKFSMLFGAAGQIRTADLILTNHRRAFQPLLYKALRRFFLSKKDEVAACLFHCFRPLISRVGHGVGQTTFRTQTRGAPPTAANQAAAPCPAHR